MTNKEKTKEFAEKYYKMYNDCTLATGIEKGAVEMAQWKDEQYKWHKVADGDLPKVNCNVLAFIDDGYTRHYNVLNYDDGDFFRYGKEQYGVIAWMELPKYKED